jgi:formylmethanofuran dehydrogenase subunit E
LEVKTMQTLGELLQQSAARHNHVCPRQVLGVRMGVLAAALLNLPLPQSDKRLLTLIETDGCFADGVAIASGCELGHRTLRLIDYGKAAATFIDTHTEQAVRIAPHPCSRERAAVYGAGEASRWHGYLKAYQTMPDDELFVVQHVIPQFSVTELLSTPSHRVSCAQCGEEIINEREIVRDGIVLCRACAGQAYYTLTPGEQSLSLPPTVLGYLTRD